MAKKKPPRIFSDQERMLIKFMAVAAVPQDEIAKYFKVRKQTLLDECSSELKEAAHGLNANVVGALYKNAMKGNVSAQIFWCKTRLGWKEVQEVKHSGDVSILLDLGDYDDEPS